MKLRKGQLGLGLWGWIFVLGVLGFFTMVGLQLVPIYLSELSIQRVVKNAAQDPGNGSLPPHEVRKALRTRWDVEGITTLKLEDVKIVRQPCCSMGYDYEARTELFANISLVVHFKNSYKMSGGGGLE